MNAAEIQSQYQNDTTTHFRVSVYDTMDNMKVGDSLFIFFKDAKPNSIRTTAYRLNEKKFLITEKGFNDRTFVKRKA